MITLDLKFIKIPLIAYSLAVVMFGIVLSNPDPLYPIEQFDGTFGSDIFYFLDFVLPFFASLSVIMQFGSTFENRTFDFFCSLPVKANPMIRWARCAVFFTSTNFICVAVAYRVLRFPVPFGRMCYLCLANTVLFLSISLLIIMLIRRIFYVFCIIYGYLLVDLTIGDTLQKKSSVFVNIFAQFPCEIINKNRMAIYIISFICVALAAIIQQTDFMRRINAKL